MKIFKCGKLYTPFLEQKNNCIVVDDGKVVAIRDEEIIQEARTGGTPVPTYIRNAEIVDLSDKIVGPGLVDIHCHGAMNSDFADGTEEDLGKAGNYHLKKGTTTLLGTVGSCTTEEMIQALKAFRSVKERTPNLYGIHLEGPYFNIKWYGCHLESMIRNPDKKEWGQFMEYQDAIKLVTIAPELPGAIEYIREFSSKGTVFSIGHSDASYEEITLAIENGLTHSTHIFCAMPFASRKNLVLQPGVFESSLINDGLTTEIIADGIHVGARLVEMVHRIKGTSKLAFVSDALRGVGCGPGDYAFGPRNGKLCRIVESPRVGITPDRPGILASSAIVLSDSIKIMSENTKLSVPEVWEMASLTPARILGIDGKKGALTPGNDADILVLNKDLSVAEVYICGERVKCL